VVPKKGLFLGGIHGKRIQEGSRDGDGRSNDRSGTHGGLESNNRCDDDNNTLDGVSNGMCYGVNLR